MKFVNPLFLSALALIAMPVIIHLFNFRRYKTVYFTNVRFLKNINDETTNRSKLKHLLVLASRILAFTFLVLAFAQPFIPVNDSVKKGTENIVSIYLDNSFSMNAASKEEPLFQLGKKKVIDIINAYSEETKFQLVTNTFEPKQQQLLSKDDIKIMLDETALTPIVKSLKEVNAFQQQLLEKYSGSKTVYLISDFQKNVVDHTFDNNEYAYNLIHLEAVKQQNLYIDSCWIEKPVLFINEPNKLFFKIGNAGTEDAQDIKVNMSINNQVKAIANTQVAAGSFTIDTISFSIQQYGVQNITVYINDFPVTFDDKYFLSFKTKEQIKVLSVNENEPNVFLRALFENQQNYALDNVLASQLNANNIGNYNLIILNNLKTIESAVATTLENYAKAGGTIIIFPDANIDINTYNTFLNTAAANNITEKISAENEVSYLDNASEIFTDVFEKIPQNLALPKTKLYYAFMKKTKSNEQVILGLKNNLSFLSEYRWGSGKLFVCASPLNKEFTDFPLHALFVPLIYKMAVNTYNTTKTSYVIGKDKQIELSSGKPISENIYTIKNEKTEWIPGQRTLSDRVYLNVDNQFQQAGFFQVSSKKATAEEWIALNFNRNESQMAAYSKADLEKKFTQKNVKILDALNTNFTEVVQQMEQGIALWKVCIILALICLAAEVLLLRFLA